MKRAAHLRSRLASWAAVARVLLLAALVAAPAAGQDPPVTFSDVALEAGFQDRLTHGRALVSHDFDGDGLMDFYIGNPSLPDVADDDNFILWNDGFGADGLPTYSKGQVLLKGRIAFNATTADYDNDGDPDLFIGIGGQEGIGFDHLFRNDDGVFVDVSDTAGIRGPWAPTGDWVPVSTSSGTWADYDQDGDLDLFVASRDQLFSLDLPGNLGTRDSLYRNEGDGTFTDVTLEAGVGSTDGSMTATWGDFDGDGWMDIFVPHHSPPGFDFYRNRHDGTFTRVPITTDEVNYGTRAVWASSVADFNRDGLLDVLAFGRRGQGGNTDSHALLVNRGNWEFTNEARSSNLAPFDEPVPTVMGTALGDFNNDGYPDVFFGNGGPASGDIDTLLVNGTRPGTDILFEDVSMLVDFPAPFDPACVPPETFEQGTMPTWVNHREMEQGVPGAPGAIYTGTLEMDEIDPCDPPYPYRGHGSIFIDVDEDGDLDLAAVKGGTAIMIPDLWSGEPNRLFLNEGGNANNSLFVRLEGTLSNRDAHGARIEVVSSQGGGDPRSTWQLWQGNTGFGASGPPDVHFGLGDDDAVESVRVWWPSGRETVLTGVAIDSRIQIDEEFLLADDFNTDAGAWSVRGGDWEVREGMFTQAADGFALATNDSIVLDAESSIIAKATYLGGQGRIGLLGRVSPNGQSFYGVFVEDGRARLVKSSEGVITMLGESMAIEPLSDDKSYIVRLDLSGDQVRMVVDRQASAWVTDGELTGGGIGLATSATQAGFDNVGVY